MLTIRLRDIAVGLLILAIIARSQQIKTKLAELRLGDMFNEFRNAFWAMPEFGRFVCYCLIGALCFSSVFVLLNNITKKRK
jgi:hypothetical protein